MEIYFISAQPDTPYFIWQLEIQLKNFNDHGIPPSQIHVLIGYDPDKGLYSGFRQFIPDNAHLARFFAYPDNRNSKRYVPSIRPHLLQQHFLQHRFLENNAIFYHDSDILFTSSLPAFDQMLDDETWYLSDTRSYLDSGFIKRHSEQLFSGMCQVLGIDEDLVVSNDANAGGAQALLKQVDHAFWQKIEDDCTSLHEYLHQYNDARFLPDRTCNTPDKQPPPFPTWCTDMWVLLWNAFKRTSVRISPKLDFCWPHEPVAFWEKMHIFHNAGVEPADAHQLFYKGYYHQKSPYGEDFSFVSKDILSYKYVQLIDSIASRQLFDLEDVTFTITVRIDSDDRLENLFCSVNHISNSFRTNILILEADSEQKVFGIESIPGVIYTFVRDDNPVFHRQIYNNRLLTEAATPFVVKYDLDAIVIPTLMYNAVVTLRYDRYQIAYPFDGRFINVKGALRSAFLKKPDIRLLYKYLDHPTPTYPSYGGCVVVKRAYFLHMGIDNTSFNGWGFEDQEIYKRSKILGLDVYRTEGPIFHLHHQRGRHSWFYNDLEMLNSYREYISVCNTTRTGLQAKIQQLHQQPSYAAQE